MKRLLSLMVAVITVFVVGFMTVKADDINLISGKKFFDGAISPVNGGKRDFHLKQVSGNNSAYAFCLDSQKFFYEGKYSTNTSNPTLGYSSSKIENVILNAYLAGLGTDKNVYGISNDELYMITQMAVWYASHGEGQNGMLPSDTYINWINEGGHEYRKTIYNELRTVASSVSKPSISIKSSQGGTKEYLTVSGKKDGFESGQFVVDGPSNLIYTVSVDENVSSKGACILYNGECKKAQEIPAGKNFKLRADYEENKDVKVNATVSSSKYLTGYLFNLYQPAVVANNQNAAVFIPTFDKFEEKISASGRYDIKRRETTLKVSKTDVTGQKEISGAEMRITDIKGNEIVSWKSDGTVKEISSSLISAGEMYKLYEDVAPAGYIPVRNAFGFVLNFDGSVTTCDLSKNDKECVKMSTDDILRIVNEPTKLTVSKTDGTGQVELDGAKMNVYELGSNVPVDSWVSSKDKSHQIEGLVIGKIYRMEENSSPVGFDKLTVNIYFKLDENGKVQLCNVKNDDENTAQCGGNVFSDENGVEYAKIDGDVLVIINYPSKTNETSLTISKRDLTTGKEVKDAYLQIFRIVNGEREEKPIYEWTSNGEDYVIKNIKPGEYVLIEVLPSPNYEADMIIEGNRVSEYKFTIAEGQNAKIVVYNELKAQKIEVPKTGVNATSVYVIGGLVMLIGAGTVVIAKKREEV